MSSTFQFRATLALAWAICVSWPVAAGAARLTPDEYLSAVTDMVTEQAPRSAQAAALIKEVYQPYVDLLALDDFGSLEQDLATGGLVPVPSDPARFNIRLRLEGSNPIGEKDVAHQNSYVSARAATIGCLLDVASRVKSGPIEVTSLVRHLEYQNQLRATNGNAATEVPTHALGLAFDIAMVNSPIETVMELRDVLQTMSDAGDIMAIVERQQLVFHVVPQPSRLGWYAELYSNAVMGRPWIGRVYQSGPRTALVTTAWGAVAPLPDWSAEWWATDNVPVDVLASVSVQGGTPLAPAVGPSATMTRYLAMAGNLLSATWQMRWPWTRPFFSLR
jgi:hypothetical protein